MKINGAVAQKLTVLTHDILRYGSCVSMEIMCALFQDLCKKDGLKVKLWRECVRTFLISVDLSCKAAAQRSGPKVWTLPDQVLLTRRFIMKVAFLLDEWGLDWTKTYNFEETCLSLSPCGCHGWWWNGKNQKPHAVSDANETSCHCHLGHLCGACVGRCAVHFPWYHRACGTRFDYRRLDDLLSQSLGVHGYSAATVLKDGGHGECACSWAGFCCAHGHGACLHQCRDQADAA